MNRVESSWVFNIGTTDVLMACSLLLMVFVWCYVLVDGLSRSFVVVGLHLFWSVAFNQRDVREDTDTNSTFFSTSVEWWTWFSWKCSQVVSMSTVNLSRRRYVRAISRASLFRVGRSYFWNLYAYKFATRTKILLYVTPGLSQYVCLFVLLKLDWW